MRAKLANWLGLGRAGFTMWRSARGPVFGWENLFCSLPFLSGEDLFYLFFFDLHLYLAEKSSENTKTFRRPAQYKFVPGFGSEPTLGEFQFKSELNSRPNLV